MKYAYVYRRYLPSARTNEEAVGLLLAATAVVIRPPSGVIWLVCYVMLCYVMLCYVHFLYAYH